MSDVLWLSLGVTALALALVVPVGGAMGWWLSRARGPLRAVLDACVLVPLVLPPSVTLAFDTDPPPEVDAAPWRARWLAIAAVAATIFFVGLTGSVVAVASASGAAEASDAETEPARCEPSFLWANVWERLRARWRTTPP